MATENRMVFQQTPTERAFVQNPYPFYARLRSAGEIVWWDDYGLPCATSFSMVNALLRDRRFGREIPPDKITRPDPRLAPFYAVEANSMLELEAPRHTRLRGLVMRAFTSRRIAGLGPEITSLSHQLIDGFQGDIIDLLPAFAQRLPVIIICRLLGVPENMADDLLRWSNAMVTMYQARRTRQNEDAAVAATVEFVAFMSGYIDERRTSPSDDLISHLIAAEEDGEKLSTDEMISTCILLLNAGHEATVHSMGNGIKALLQHELAPDILTPGHIEQTSQEIFRYDPPLHMFTRWAYDDVEIAGHKFAKGDEVALLLAAANRDETIWDNPEVFDPARPVKPNTSFGAGAHFCLGVPLARLELALSIPILFMRCPNIKLLQTPEYANLYHFHGLEALRVQL